MNLLLRIVVLGGILCLVSCHRAEATQAESPPPGRRDVQRAALQAPIWQFVVCSEDEALNRYVDSLADSRPLEKKIRVVACADWDYSLPSIVFGDRVPEPIHELPTTAFGSSDGDTWGELMVLNNYLNPLTAKDSMPSVVSLYLSNDPARLLRFLRTVPSEWGGVFRWRWAYEIHAADGSRRMGDFAERNGWRLAGEEEVVLQSPGAPVLEVDGVQVFAVDNYSPSPKGLSLAEIVAAALTENASVERIYLYPTVERIGLWQGSMNAHQLQGRDLHLVPDHLHYRSARPAWKNDFLRGMTVAHEGYRVYNGYGGSGMGPSLDSLQQLHVNAVSIVPYTFMREPGLIDELPVPNGAGSENDPAVRAAIREAKARGCFILLKPQIWVSGGWPGDVHFERPADWDRFFAAYGNWIAHYARMAEEEGVDALCIGTELVQTTLGHPVAWRAIIADLRRQYTGQLTYAANWGPEFENLSFWDDLDAIGLNSYYPLSGGSEPSDEELRRGAEAWMRLADSISTTYDRPLWLTEVGYRSVAGAWINPHAEAGDRPADEVDQARCYAALIAAGKQSERLRGMFVWKWPSYLGHDEGRQGNNTGFTPGGKPAGALLSEFYRDVR
ncbi:hypothetical protein [Lewinella sp. JB7]|uniref:glycoside hydrolase family 113 n=1 Tax=Lewinella sp. JB7 TaxID=2962887 RepID=UPI0020C98C73|nr:hypothetical protein [Lewinella sp. JB7]MCP9235357.1 hypothetical protein [Lewinella sp. JB7]